MNLNDLHLNDLNLNDLNLNDLNLDDPHRHSRHRIGLPPHEPAAPGVPAHPARHPHAEHRGHGTPPDHRGSLNRLALSATLHCLTGCSIGEILGMVIGTALGWGVGATIALAVTLAFAFGYALTMLPLWRAGLPFRRALKLALAADTASITIMEIVDNAIMLIIPGAMDSGLDSGLFWASLAVALVLAAVAAYPVNRWLLARGRGHAVVHAYH